MSYLGAAEITRMKAEAEDTMLDTCQIGVRTSGDFGDPSGTASYAYGSGIACGVAKGGGAESDEGAQADISAVTIRLPMGTTVSSKDRIKVTHRRGTALAADEYYSINGDPAGGTVALLVSATRLDGNSQR